MFEQVVESYIALATASLEAGDQILASRMLDAALAEAERFDCIGVDVARVARRVAGIYSQFEIYDTSLGLLNRSLSILRTQNKHHAIECSLVLMDLAELARTLSRPRGAKSYLARAEKILESAPLEGIDQYARKRLQNLQANLHHNALSCASKPATCTAKEPRR